MKKNLAIIVEDNTICIDGRCLSISENINFGLECNIHAIQWNEIEKKGHIEYKEKIPNKIITNIEKYKFVIDLYYAEIEKQKENQKQQAEELELNINWEELFKKIRTSKLYESDWTQLADNNLSESQKESWKKYRQDLRDLPNKVTDYKTLCKDLNYKDWPTTPIN